jgi:ribosome-associated translation inhibitor RaiA
MNSEREPRRQRRTGSDQKRAPFAEVVPRPVRKAAGRTPADLVPAHIRIDGVELDPDHRVYIRQRLGMKLGKFATSIERVTVRVRDVNGPRGGVDHSCRMKVVLEGLPTVVVEERSDTLETAVNGALAGAERAVRRSIQRRRTKPAKGARSKP